MNIVVIPGTNYNNAPAGFDAAVKYVTNLFDRLFTANVTVYINVDYGQTDNNNQPVPPLGKNFTNFDSFDYSTVRQRLINMGEPGSNTLPTTSPFPNATLWLTTAQQKAMGLLPANFQPGNGYPLPGVDGYVGVASNATLQANGGFSWSFSPTATPASNQYYIVGTLEHEFSEVLGRDSFDRTNAFNNAPSYAIMDLFRYSAANARQLNANGTAYFSINNGTTILDYWNNKSLDANGDLGDWWSSGPGKVTGPDAFLDQSPSGQINGVTPTDMTLMNAIGWSAVTPKIPDDFTGNGISDVLLQNGGTVVDWLMQNGRYSSGNVLTTGASGWSVVGTGDFTGSGTSDVLLQNGGTIVDWIMQNGQYQSGNVITTGAAGWQVVGTGDFNGDGTSDVLLQNGGTVVDWIMKNGQYQSGNVLTTGAAGWQVAGGHA